MIVADSDVLIDALEGQEPAAGRVALELGRGSLATTAISVFELLSGTRSGRTRERIERFLATVTILPVDEEGGRRAAEVRRALEARGSPIGMADYLIAGICIARSLPLLTRNRSEFEKVPGLRVAELEPSAPEPGAVRERRARYGARKRARREP